MNKWKKTFMRTVLEVQIQTTNYNLKYYTLFALC